MRKLIEKFYSFSPVKRVVILVTAIVMVAFCSTAYSFITLMGLLSPFYSDTSSAAKPAITGLNNLLEKANHQFIDADTKAAFASWKTLTEQTDKFLELKGSDLLINEKAVGQEKEIIAAIKTFSSLNWKYMVLFASPQLDPLDNKLVERFKTIRDVARFMAVFYPRFKEKFPEENSAFIFTAILKLARMTDLSSPFLIGKMISIAVDGIALHGLKTAIDAGGLSQQEAADCHADILMSLALDRPMLMALSDEFVFFKYAYSRFYTKAPLAMWVLDLIGGDPMTEYLSLNSQLQGKTDAEAIFKSIRHPLLIMAYPNFRKAGEAYAKRLAEKSIMAAELSQIAGQLQISVDPYTDEPLKSGEKQGKTIFYSVGPDKTDGHMSGDDFTLEQK